MLVAWGSPLGTSQRVSRRFRAPWQVEQIPGGYKVLDASGQALVYVYARETREQAVIEIVLQRAAVCSVRSALQRGQVNTKRPCSRATAPTTTTLS